MLLLINVLVGAERFRLIVVDVLKRDQSFADIAEILGKLFRVQSDIDASSSFVLIDIINDLVHLVLKVLLIAFVVSNQCGKTLVSF